MDVSLSQLFLSNFIDFTFLIIFFILFFKKGNPKKKRGQFVKMLKFLPGTILLISLLMALSLLLLAPHGGQCQDRPVKTDGTDSEYVSVFVDGKSGKGKTKKHRSKDRWNREIFNSIFLFNFFLILRTSKNNPLLGFSLFQKFSCFFFLSVKFVGL